MLWEGRIDVIDPEQTFPGALLALSAARSRAGVRLERFHRGPTDPGRTASRPTSTVTITPLSACATPSSACSDAQGLPQNCSSKRPLCSQLPLRRLPRGDNLLSARVPDPRLFHQAGLQSFRSIRRIEARRRNASALRLRFSQSLASLRQRLSQAMVRSTIQRLGNTTNPLA